MGGQQRKGNILRIIFLDIVYGFADGFFMEQTRRRFPGGRRQITDCCGNLKKERTLPQPGPGAKLGIVLVQLLENRSRCIIIQPGYQRGEKGGIHLRIRPS